MKFIVKMNKLHLVLFITFLGFILSLVSCVPGYEITTTHIPLPLGDSTVNLVLHEVATPGLTYLNLHDDENTSVRAALDGIKRHGGSVFELQHTGTRNITFKLDGIKYEFDPNRMFSDNGAAASLERFGPVSKEAIAAVRSFADAVLEQIKPTELDVLVTLHNNGRGGYSILSYTAVGEYAQEATKVYVNDEVDADDFYFVTALDLYDKLRHTKQNVVLQDNVNVTEDGSLSVWSAQQHLPYVNIEAQDGHRRSQTSMILRLHQLFFPSQDFE
jgi:hypothetical protein